MLDLFDPDPVEFLEQSAENAVPDTTAPRVTDVIVDSGGPDIASLLSDGSVLPSGIAQLEPLPWSGIDQIAFRFDEEVQIDETHLTLHGTRSAPAVDGFNYDAASRTAIWWLEAPLGTDRYQFALDDDVEDIAGNALDGEWRDGISMISGNGMAGGAFELRFDVQVGDVDRDGDTDVGDYALLDTVLNAGSSDPVLDLDRDGGLSSNDLSILRAAMGERRPEWAAHSALLVISLGDLTGDGDDALGVFQAHSSPRLSVIDPASQAVLQSIALSDAFAYTELERLETAGGATALVVLGRHLENGALRAWIWEPGNTTTTVSLGKSIQAVDLEIGPDGKLLVLGSVLDSDVTRIWEIDPVSSARQNWVVASNLDPQDLEVSPAADGLDAELAVLGTVQTTDSARAFLLDAALKTRTGSISFGRVEIADFAVRPDVSGEGRTYIALHDNADSPVVRADMRDKNGMRTRLLSLDADASAFGIEADVGGDLAIFTQNRDGAHTVVHIVDPADGLVFTANMGSGFNTTDFAVARYQGELGVALAQSNALLGTQQIKVRLPEANLRIGTTPVAQAANPTAWFTDSLVHGHTRARAAPPFGGAPSESYLGTDIFNRTGEFFAELGAKVFTRHGKSSDEDPWWPSEVILDPNGQQQFRDARENSGQDLAPDANPLQQSITNAWDAGLPLLAYYSDSGDATVAAAHPEWIAKDADGNLLSHRTKGYYLDLTGPYGDIVEQRLLELADMGASGIYLDFRHLPPGGLWGTPLEDAYLAETGLAAPDSVRGNAYEDYLKFIQKRLAQTMEGWRDTLAEEYPHFQLVISVTTVPALTRLDMGVDLVAVSAPKSELMVALSRGQSNSVHLNNPDLHAPDQDIRQGFGWALLRDAAGEAKPHVWDAWSPNGDHDQAFIAAVTTYGGIAALDVYEEQLTPGNEVLGIASRAELKDSFALGAAVSPHLSEVEPLGATAVLWNDAARDALFSEGDVAMWEQVNLPSIGGFEAFSDLGQSPLVLTTLALNHDIPGSVRTLYAPNTDALTPEQMAALSRFQAKGGVIVTGDPNADWSTSAGYAAALSDLKDALQAAPSAPVTVAGLPDKAHGVAYRSENEGDADTIVIAITNDFTFHQRSLWEDPVPEADINPTPDDIPQGVLVQIASEMTVGRSASDFVAYEAVTGNVIDIMDTAEGLSVSLPAIARMAVVVIQPV